MSITDLPLPKVLQDGPSLATLRNQMAKAKLADQNVHNLAKSIFKPDVQLVYRKGGNPNPILARVVGVIGAPGRTRVTVEKISNKRREDIQLEDITGIMQS